MKTEIKTESEEAFEKYLENQNIPYHRISTSDEKQPDYRIRHEGCDCYFEVKEFHDPPAGRHSGLLCPPIEKKIKRAAKQFTEYCDCCCALVLWNKSIFRSVQPMVVLSAAFGNCVDIPDSLDPAPPTYRVLKSGLLTATSNRRISAIVILTTYALNHNWVKMWQELYAKKERGETIQPEDQFEILARFGPPEYSYQGTRRAIVVENPHARIPLPSTLFVGPFDQRWRSRADRFELVFWGGELEKLRSQGIPHLYL